jgi:hypothetical protein
MDSAKIERISKALANGRFSEASTTCMEKKKSIRFRTGVAIPAPPPCARPVSFLAVPDLEAEMVDIVLRESQRIPSRARPYSQCPWRITAQIGAQLLIRRKSSDPE